LDNKPKKSTLAKSWESRNELGSCVHTLAKTELMSEPLNFLLFSLYFAPALYILRISSLTPLDLGSYSRHYLDLQSSFNSFTCVNNSSKQIILKNARITHKISQEAQHQNQCRKIDEKNFEKSQDIK